MLKWNATVATSLCNSKAQNIILYVSLVSGVCTLAVGSLDQHRIGVTKIVVMTLGLQTTIVYKADFCSSSRKFVLAGVVGSL